MIGNDPRTEKPTLILLDAVRLAYESEEEFLTIYLEDLSVRVQFAIRTDIHDPIIQALEDLVRIITESIDE